MTSEKNEIEANNAAIKDIGSYLLKGWVLSDVHCESCSFPLVRTKDKENWICTSCKAAQSRVNEEPKINNPVVSNNSTDTVAPFEGDLVSSMKTKKNEEYFINGHSLQLEQRTSQSRDASKLLGEKLLNGWALLGEICPNESCYGVPLVKNREQQKFCVICQRFYIRDQGYISKITEPVRSSDEKLSLANQEIEQSAIGNDKTNVIDSDGDDHTFAIARRSLLSKIEELSYKLEDESNPHQIIALTEAISSCASTLCHFKP